MEISINVEGKTYIVSREKLLQWLRDNAKTYTDSNSTFNEYRKIDDQGRTILNG
jgi:flavin-dependent dehydrogenase